MKKYFPLVMLAILLTSCIPATVPPTLAPTRPAAPSLTPTSTASATDTATPAGMLSIETIAFDLPDEIADRLVIENFPTLISPITDEPVPRHITLILENYPVESQFRGEVNIFVFKESHQFQELRRNLLQGIINDQTSPQEYLESIDLFSAEDIRLRAKKVDFQNGSGASYLYYWGVGPGIPVSNDRLVYMFNGLTNDNQYFVQAYLPVRVPFLDDAIDLSQPVGSAPPGIVPYPDYDDRESVGKYYDTLYRKLDRAEADVFSPSLDTLDVFINSLLLVVKE